MKNLSENNIKVAIKQNMKFRKKTVYQDAGLLISINECDNGQK